MALRDANDAHDLRPHEVGTDGLPRNVLREDGDDVEEMVGNPGEGFWVGKEVGKGDEGTMTNKEG